MNYDDRIQAVLEHINNESGENYTPADVEVSENYNSDVKYTEYKTPEGTFLCMTEDESYEYLAEDIENLIDDIGIDDTFGEGYKDYVYDNFVEWNGGEDYMKEDYRSYYEDIESESASDDIFENRLQEELFEKCCDVSVDMDDYKDYAEKNDILNIFTKEAFREPDDMEVLVRDFKEMLLEDSIHIFEDENGVLSTNDEVFEEIVKWVNDENRSIDDFERIENAYFETLYPYSLDDFHSINEWFFNYEDNKDDLIEQAVDKIIEEYDSPVDWANENFGKDFIKRLADNGELTIDYDGIAHWTESIDSFGRISSYDGQYDECGDYLIYKSDSASIDRVSEKDDFQIADYMPEGTKATAECVRENQIRDNFEVALDKVDDGCGLSKPLGWGFSDLDIHNLAVLYLKREDLQEKICDLLEDCNFHTECGDFADGNASKWVKTAEELSALKNEVRGGMTIEERNAHLRKQIETGEYEAEYADRKDLVANYLYSNIAYEHRIDKAIENLGMKSFDKSDIKTEQNKTINKGETK